MSKKNILIWLVAMLAVVSFLPRSFDARGLLYGIWQKSGDSIFFTGDKVLINTDKTGLKLNLPDSEWAIRLKWSTSNLVTGALTYWLHAGTYSLVGIDQLWLRTIQWPAGVVDTANGKRWWDASYAVSCDAYRNPSSWWDTTHKYVWAVWNGNYLVDPDKDGTPEFVCNCSMSSSTSTKWPADASADGRCDEINGGYSRLDYSKIDWSKIDWSKIDYSKIDWSKIDYSKIDYSKLANISYSRWGGGWKQNIYKFAVHNFGWNKYWIIADNIDADKDGKAEWCNEDIPGLSKSNCILYTASLDNKRFVSSVYWGWNSDNTANHYDAVSYCRNYGKFGLNWHLPAMKRTSDCDSYSDWWKDESCILYKYGPRDNWNTRTNPTPRLYWIISSRYPTSSRNNSGRPRYRHTRHGLDWSRDRDSRPVRCLAQ